MSGKTKTVQKKHDLPRCDLPMLLSLLLTGAGYFISIIAYALNGRTAVDADEAAEMVLAAHLNQTGRFLSRDWFYSTELRVLNTQIINRLTLALFPDNWHAARTLSIAILTFILAVSYLYLIWTANLGWIGVLTTLALVVPFSTTYSYIVLYGSFYVPHIAITFLLLALTLQAERSPHTLLMKLSETGSDRDDVDPQADVPAAIPAGSRRTYVIALTAACILSFIAGLGGVRQFLVFHTPLCLTAFVLLFLERHQVDSLREILGCRKGKLFCISIAEAFFCVAGVGVNSVILHRFFVFSEYTKTSLNSLKMTEFLDYLGSVIHIWGYEGCAELRDITGAAALCGLMLCAIFLLMTAFLIRRFKSLLLQEQIFLLFFLSGVFTNVVFYLFANLPVPRYLMPSAIMILPLIPVSFRQKNGFGRSWRAPILICFCFCLFVQSTNYFWYYAFKDRGLKSTPEQEAAAWLQENDYSKGFATFWNSDILTELSDGDIEMWTLHNDQIRSDWSGCELYEWLQVRSHRDALPDGQVFLAVSSEECDELFSLPKMSARPAFSNEKLSIFTFDSAEDMFMQLSGSAIPELSGSRR